MRIINICNMRNDNFAFCQKTKADEEKWMLDLNLGPQITYKSDKIVKTSVPMLHSVVHLNELKQRLLIEYASVE